MKAGKRKAFTLIECVVALLLFAIVSVLISGACFNCLSSVDKIKKDSQRDALIDYIRGKSFRSPRWRISKTATTYTTPTETA